MQQYISTFIFFINSGNSSNKSIKVHFLFLIIFVFFVVLVVVRAEELHEPVSLPPWLPSHLCADIITVINAVGRDAVPLVEPCGPLHDLSFLADLLKHRLHSWKLEPLLKQPLQPFAPQLRCVKIRHTLNVPNKRHVRYQGMYRSSEMIH